MKKQFYFLFFISLFTLISISSISAINQEASIAHVDLGNDGLYCIDMFDFFTDDIEQINVTFNMRGYFYSWELTETAWYNWSWNPYLNITSKFPSAGDSEICFLALGNDFVIDNMQLTVKNETVPEEVTTTIRVSGGGQSALPPIHQASFEEQCISGDDDIVYNFNNHFNNADFYNVSWNVGSTSYYWNNSQGGSTYHTTLQGLNMSIVHYAFTDDTFMTVTPAGAWSILPQVDYSRTWKICAINHDFNPNFEYCQYATTKIDNTSCYGDRPNFISQFPKTQLGNEEGEFFDLSDYFYNFDSVHINWNDDSLGISAQLECGIFEPQRSIQGDLKASCSGYGEDTQLVIDNYDSKNKQINITVTAFNDYGQYSSVLWVNLTGSDEYEDFTDDYSSGGGSIVSYISGLFSSLYPNHSLLSTKQRYSYVFVTMFFVSVLMMFFLLSTGYSKFLGLVIFVTEMFLFFYFIAIKYISTSIIVIGSLILVSIPLIKSKVIS